MAKPQRELPEAVTSLPVEMQAAIIAALDSRPHLKALSLASKQLNVLTAEVLHANISFDEMAPPTRMQSYLQHTAPRYGNLCRTLSLSMSLGPLNSREDDVTRADLFVQLLRATAEGRLTTIHFNAAGSDIRDSASFLMAISAGYGSAATAKNVSLRLLSMDAAEMPVVSHMFERLSSGRALPMLQRFSLEGYWNLSNEDKTSRSSILTHFIKSLQSGSLANLESLRLAYMRISRKDLYDILKCVTPGCLQNLDLDEIHSLSLSDACNALTQTPTALSLRSLRFQLNASEEGSLDMTIPSLDVIGLRLPSLKHLAIGITRYFVEVSSLRHAAPDTGLISFVSSFCTAATSQIYLPALQSITISDAFSRNELTSAALALLLVRSNQSIAPSLERVWGGEQLTMATSPLSSLNGFPSASPFKSNPAPAACVHHGQAQINDIARRILSIANIRLYDTANGEICCSERRHCSLLLDKTLSTNYYGTDDPHEHKLCSLHEHLVRLAEEWHTEVPDAMP